MYALVDRVFPVAEPLPTEHGTYFRWADPSGAELWLQVGTENDLLGMNPHFTGKSVVRVRLTARVETGSPSALDGRFHGWAAPVSGANGEPEGTYPFVFDAPDAVRHDALGLPALVTAQVAAFAHEIAAHASPEEFSDAQTEGPRFASQSFIPSGLFVAPGDDAPPRAEAFFAGHVLEAEVRTNQLTGKDFIWCLVDTLGGTFDVVVDPDLLPDLPQVGGVIQGSFWLSGRILEQ